MGRTAKVTLPWADGDYAFKLGLGELNEHDQLCDAGPAWIAQTLTNLTFRTKFVRETIRLGLIGGGMLPSEALRLVKRHVDERPIMENVGTAFAILMAALYGEEDALPEKAAAAEDKSSQPSADGSPSPPSSETPPPSASRRPKPASSPSGN